MWVNAYEWKRLKERVEALESRKPFETITVYDQEQVKAWATYGGWGGHFDKQEIGLADIVQRIMAKLGMELKYVKGAPARIDLAEKEVQSPAASMPSKESK